MLRKTRTLKNTCSVHRNKCNNKFLSVFLFNYILHKIIYKPNIYIYEN